MRHIKTAKAIILGNSRKLWQIFAIFLLFFTMAGNFITAKAQLQIDIDNKFAQPLRLALPGFLADNKKTDLLADTINKIIGQDLSGSGLFTLLPENSYIQNEIALYEIPLFPEWTLIRTQILAYGTIKNVGRNRYILSYRLWDVFARKNIDSFIYEFPIQDSRRIGHKLADRIYSRLTAANGYFDSQIVYIAEKSTNLNVSRRLAIMDIDGANHQYIIDNDEGIILTPRFSPTGKEIVYNRIYDNKVNVYWLDLLNGEQANLGDFTGIVFAPRYISEDGWVLLSLAKSGNTEIWEMNIRDGQRNRLTYDLGIDTSPSSDPNGKNIVFNSDRGGTPQLYIMQRDGQNVKRISFGSGAYTSPVWSPAGDWIAFIRQRNAGFELGILKPDGTNERILDRDFLIDSPSWSPNGQAIAYYKEYVEAGKKIKRIFTININGKQKRLIETPGDAVDPAWSPQNNNL